MRDAPAAPPRFHRIASPDDQDLAEVLLATRLNISRRLARRGIDLDHEMILDYDELADQEPILSLLPDRVTKAIKAWAKRSLEGWNHSEPQFLSVSQKWRSPHPRAP